MPVHEYRCAACGFSFEKLIFKGDDARIRCPECGSGTVKPAPGPESFMDRSSIGTCVAKPPKGPS